MKISSTVRQAGPMAEAIEKLLYPYAEVVLHDLASNRVAYIFNSFSKRKRGSDSLLEKQDFDPSMEVIGPYEKTNWDGRRLKAISAIIRSDNGAAEGLLCINVDVSHFDRLQDVISHFTNRNLNSELPSSLFKDDWQEKINIFVHQYLRDKGETLQTASKELKREIIGTLKKEGALNRRRAPLYIGQILGVSRATVYNYLSKEGISLAKTTGQKNIRRQK